MNNSNINYSQKVVEMKNITKKFGSFVANDNINLTVHKGEVHALLGENGAGKSTLMNILYGLYQQTSGEIYINEKLVNMDSKWNRYGSSALYASATFYCSAKHNIRS